MKDKYLHFNVEDLVCDDDFIQWVLFADPALDDKWNRWIQSNPYKKQELDEAARILKAIQFKDPEISIDKEKLWNRIRSTNKEHAFNQRGHSARKRLQQEKRILKIFFSSCMLYLLFRLFETCWLIFLSSTI